MKWDDLITIGRASKPQGRHGEVLVEVISDRPERFPELERVFVSGPGGAVREVVVESSWPHKGKFVVKFQGVDSIDAADAYRGLELRIPEEELEALPQGSYYHYQLKGLTVVDAAAGRVVGRIEDLLETGAAVVLVVRDGARETLIPLADAFVQSVDLAAGRMVVKVPEMARA